MIHELSFIKAEVKDFDCIFSIIKKVRLNSEKENVFQWDDTYPTKEIVLNDIAAEHTFFIYEDNKKVGFLVLNNKCEHNDPNRIKWLNNGKFLFLHRFCIDPDFQKSGLGTNVLKKIETDAIADNVLSIRLDVFSTNEHAIYLYEKLGYAKLGEDLCNRGIFYIYEKLL